MPKLETLCIKGRCMEIDPSVDAYTKAETDALLDDKVDKIAGKGLSSHDYTTAEKNKLAGIEEGAEVNVQPDWNVTNTSSDAYIKNKPGNATSTKDGFMSAADKAKLNTVEEGAEKNVQSDWNQTDSAKDDFIKNKPTNATQSKDGFLSKEDKKKIDELTTTYYTKTEVDTIIDDLEFGIMKVVDALPATGEEHIIYLVPKPAPETGFNEYLWVADSSRYELIGDTNVDLSDYYTKTQTDTLLNNKVDKVAGKGLSTNDYTTAEKTKLAGIEAGAEVNVQADWNQTDSTKDSFIKNKPGKASTTADGLMSKEDKTKLDSIDWTKEGILRLLGLEEVLLAITGKEGAEERKIILAKDAPAPATYRTALYPDGHLIINESSYDHAANEAAHDGAAVGAWDAFDPDTNPYAFTADGDQPWYSNIDDILSVEFGSAVAPTSTFRWFSAMHNVVTINLTGLDTTNTTTFERMFSQCNKLKNVNTESLDTANVTSMMMTFYRCDEVETLDLSTWDTSKVTTMNQMFRVNGKLKTIYASALFTTGAVTNSNNMFAECSSLVGGAGTTFNSAQVTAGYARIDNPPTAPGYFTAKP